MDDSRKLINWVAGIATLIAALLIVIVVLEPKEGGVSRAAASRTVALTIASKEEIEDGAPAESCFPEELRDQWYVKYMDFLCLDSGFQCREMGELWRRKQITFS